MMDRRQYWALVFLALTAIGAVAVLCLFAFSSDEGGVRAASNRARVSRLADEVTGEEGDGDAAEEESDAAETQHAELASAKSEFAPLLGSASVPEVTPERASELNQVMDALLDRAEIPGDYVEVMCAIARDRRHGEQMRAFALQHLGLWARERKVRGGYDPAAADAVRVRHALRSALGETATPIGGVALLALDGLARVDSRIDAVELADKAVRILSDPNAHVQTRLAAIGFCGAHRVKAAEADLRRLVSAAGATVAERRAAERALAEL